MAAQRRSPYFRNLRLRFHGCGLPCCLEPTARRGIFETSGITREVKTRGVGEAFLWRWRFHNASDLQARRCCRYTEVSQTGVRDGFARVVKNQESFLTALSPLLLPSYIAPMATYITPCLKFSHIRLANIRLKQTWLPTVQMPPRPTRETRLAVSRTWRWLGIACLLLSSEGPPHLIAAINCLRHRNWLPLSLGNARPRCPAGVQTVVQSIYRFVWQGFHSAPSLRPSRSCHTCWGRVDAGTT